MNFLGSIGIDFKLLIAQIVNFIILLFILNKFVYKPIMQRIEKDKEKLQEAQEEEKELEEKTTEAKKQSYEILTSSRKKAEEIIKEAQKVAEDIKEKANKKKVEKKEKKDEKEVRPSSNLDLSAVSEIFENKDIKKKAGEYFFKRLMITARQTLPKHPETKKFVLEYASPISPDDWAQLKSFVVRAFGEDAKLDEKENESLIAGYRLIAGNQAIDENIAYEIKNEIREAE